MVAASTRCSVCESVLNTITTAQASAFEPVITVANNINGLYCGIAALSIRPVSWQLDVWTLCFGLFRFCSVVYNSNISFAQHENWTSCIAWGKAIRWHCGWCLSPKSNGEVNFDCQNQTFIHVQCQSLQILKLSEHLIAKICLPRSWNI